MKKLKTCNTQYFDNELSENALPNSFRSFSINAMEEFLKLDLGLFGHQCYWARPPHALSLIFTSVPTQRYITKFSESLSLLFALFRFFSAMLVTSRQVESLPFRGNFESEVPSQQAKWPKGKSEKEITFNSAVVVNERICCQRVKRKLDGWTQTSIMLKTVTIIFILLHNGGCDKGWYRCRKFVTIRPKESCNKGKTTIHPYHQQIFIL